MAGSSSLRVRVEMPQAFLQGERQRDFVDPAGKGSTGRPPHLIQKVPSRSANLETLIDYQPTQPGRWQTWNRHTVTRPGAGWAGAPEFTC